jgi:hypothetical protein
METKKASAELLFAQKDTFGSVPVNLDVTDIISEQKNSLKAAGSAIFENILPVTQNVLTAVGTANVRFFSQLGDAGNILGGNLFNLGAAAGEVTSKLLSRYVPSVTPLSTVCHSSVNCQSLPCQLSVTPLSTVCHSPVTCQSLPCQLSVTPLSTVCHSPVNCLPLPCQLSATPLSMSVTPPSTVCHSPVNCLSLPCQLSVTPLSTVSHSPVNCLPLPSQCLSRPRQLSVTPLSTVFLPSFFTIYLPSRLPLSLCSFLPYCQPFTLSPISFVALLLPALQRSRASGGQLSRRQVRFRDEWHSQTAELTPIPSSLILYHSSFMHVNPPIPGKISELVTYAPSALKDLSQAVVGSTVAITGTISYLYSYVSCVCVYVFVSLLNPHCYGYWGLFHRIDVTCDCTWCSSNISSHLTPIATYA